jgi:hypothetical protein
VTAPAANASAFLLVSLSKMPGSAVGTAPAHFPAGTFPIKASDNPAGAILYSPDRRILGSILRGVQPPAPHSSGRWKRSAFEAVFKSAELFVCLFEFREELLEPFL